MKLYRFVSVGFEVVIIWRLREFSVPRGWHTDQNLLLNCTYLHSAFPAAAAISSICRFPVILVDLLLTLVVS